MLRMWELPASCGVNVATYLWDNFYHCLCRDGHSEVFHRADRGHTDLDSASESNEIKPIASDAGGCLFHVQFKRSC